MVMVFIGWLLAAGAVAFGSYRFTKGNTYYAAAFTLMTLFAPPIGLTAFVLFFLLRSLMPPVREVQVISESESPEIAEHGHLEKNLHYATQLEAAEKALKKATEAFNAVEARINAIDPKTEGAMETLKDLEAEKTECAVKMIAAEEAYERLRKLQH